MQNMQKQICKICHIKKHFKFIPKYAKYATNMQNSDKWFVKASSSQMKMRIKARPTCPDKNIMSNMQNIQHLFKYIIYM